MKGSFQSAPWDILVPAATSKHLWLLPDRTELLVSNFIPSRLSVLLHDLLFMRLLRVCKIGDVMFCVSA